MTDSDYTITRSPIQARAAFQENQSWQRNDLGLRGRSAGRDYYDRRSTAPNVDRVRPITSRDSGRALRVAGLVLISAGVAGWVWLILEFVSAIGAGTIPDHPFSTRLSGIPVGSAALVAIVAGVLLATIGTWLARLAQNRRESTWLSPDQWR